MIIDKQGNPISDVDTSQQGNGRDYKEPRLVGDASGLGEKTGLYKMPENAQALQTDGQLRNGASWGTDKPQSARNIRRLTPTECERLQGFPDGWTKDGLTKDGGQVDTSDTQRYKCLGNAVTTNVVEAIGKQLLKGWGEKPCQ